MRYSALLLATFAAFLACVSAAQGGGERASRGDSRTISADELSGATQLNLYDYVKATHPRWLVSAAGSRSFPVVVFMDETQLGSVETLRTMGLAEIRAVRYFEASAAQSRFNRVGMGPVIQVVTH